MEKALPLPPPLFPSLPKKDHSHSFSCAFSTTTEDDEEEAVIRGLSADRLFFDSGITSSSLVESVGDGGGTDENGAPAFNGGTAVAVESTDPFGDFRASMGEMAEAQGVALDWAWMEDMLGWFLRANAKGNHGFIISAFLDLVVSLPDHHHHHLLLHVSSSSSSPIFGSRCPASCSSTSSCSCEVEELPPNGVRRD